MSYYILYNQILITGYYSVLFLLQLFFNVARFIRGNTDYNANKISSIANIIDSMYFPKG